MKTLRECIAEAEAHKVAIGHFNISNLEGVWAVFNAAKGLNVPVIIGVSEGERDFVGVKQIAAVVKSIREEHQYPIYLNGDHTYSFEKVKEAVDAGFDAVIVDGAKLPFEENLKLAKQCVEYAKSVNPDMLIEGELGYIGQSSKLLDAIPEGVTTSGEGLTHPEQAAQFVKETGVDLLAPAVGNVHGMLKVGNDPRLDIERIKQIREATGVPLVLHGGSGTVNEDFTNGIKNGIAIVHINTELRVAFRKGLQAALQENPDEIAPYKYLKPALQSMQKVAEERLRLFNGI
jgi:fructose-bisphosphate aldolase, class II